MVIQNVISLKEAKKRAKERGINVSIPTLIEWIVKNQLGHQPGGHGGRWYIYEEKFNKYIDGEL